MVLLSKESATGMEVTLQDYMGSDLSVVNAARVSFNKKSTWDWENDSEENLRESDQKLIKYLAKHGHYAPFGHCFATFHVKAPLFVRSQLVKHEYLRFSEISRRYVTEDPTFYFPKEWRKKAEDKKQGSSPEETVSYPPYLVSNAVSITEHVYKDMILSGVAPEMARMVLPQNMYTEWYWSGSLDAFANMYSLRVGHGAQEETKQIAQGVGKFMETLFPHSWNALVKEC
jgi:thymidylate synthase (FAD)